MAYVLPGQRSETVRRANLSAILRELHNRGPVSRSELGTRTGLTRSAVRGLIGELALAGLVSEERGTPQGTPGRPSPLVRPSPRCGIVLALEITVDSLAVAAVSIGGEVIDVVRLDRPRDRSTVDETVADLAALARAVLRRLPDTDGMIGIGVAVVGIVRRDTGVVTMAPNLGWRDVPWLSAWRTRWGRRCRSPWPTRPTSARWPSCAAAPPSARGTSSSSPARSAWAGA